MSNATQTNGIELGAMNHPSREEWMSYLYGELPRTSKAAMAQHLRSCAVCQMDVTLWQNAKSSLGTWKLARRRPAAATVVFSGAKWALAALVVLGLGFTIGRFTPANADTRALRVALAPELKAALLPELKTEMAQQLKVDYQAVLAGGPAATSTDFRRQLCAVLEDTRRRAVTTAMAQSQRALLEFVESYRTDRDQAQQNILTVLTRAEQKEEAAHLNLRRALETVAVVADDKFQRTETQLGQLASYAQGSLNSDTPAKSR
jgi:hypothetical protein